MAESPAASARREARRPILVLVALVCSLVLAACTGGSQTAPSAPPEEKSLVIGATLEPASLDPTADAAVAGSQAMLYNVYETLVKMDAEGNLDPLLAQSWDVSADNRTYTFRLNPAAKFADGAPVDATAVEQNINRIRNETVATKYKSVMAVVESTNVVDPHTIEVTLARPSNTWLYEMTSTAGMVMNPAGFASLKEATAGSGPLQLREWTVNYSIEFERNPAYWGTPIRFDAVTFRYIADPNAMNAAMLSGELDIISNLQAPDAIDQFADPGRFTVLEGSTNGEVVLGLNNSNPALADPRVRQAITQAIDKRALVDNVWNGRGTVIGTMTVPTDPYYEDLSGVYPYDPERARQLLAEAGYGSGLTLRLKPAAIPYATRAAQFIASQLGAVGVQVSVEEQQFPATWLDVVYTRADYDMTIVAHVEPRDMWTYSNPDYYWRYTNEQFNGLLASADAGTPEQYVTDMKAAARVLADDAASVWLWVLPNIVVTRAGISGVAANATTLAFDVTTIATA